MRSSQIQLSKKKNREIRTNFATLLADIKNPIEMHEFLESFLSDNEYLGLSKRLAILKLLAKGHSYESIQDALNVSSATISSTANFKNDKVLAKVIQKLEVDDWASDLAKKIISLFTRH
ncbi:hypothetical protein KKD03_00420 [Patescibacteria group bacterium]|nr:hypothetical protein [Patescibacteria group bacterium]